MILLRQWGGRWRKPEQLRVGDVDEDGDQVEGKEESHSEGDNMEGENEEAATIEVEEEKELQVITPPPQLKSKVQSFK